MTYRHHKIQWTNENLKQMHVAGTNGGKKRVHVGQNIGFRFTSDWRRKCVTEILNKSQSVAMKSNCEQL